MVFFVTFYFISSHVSNRKPDAQIKLTLDMDDYYRIKDAKSGESDE